MRIKIQPIGTDKNKKETLQQEIVKIAAKNLYNSVFTGPKTCSPFDIEPQSGEPHKIDPTLLQVQMMISEEIIQRVLLVTLVPLIINTKTILRNKR